MNRTKHNPKAYSPALYIPCWLSQVPTQLISNSAKILYGRLAQWSNENGDVYRSATQLSQEIGATVRNVERYLKELRGAGLIGTFQPQSGGVNHFEFYEHEWMHLPIKEQLAYKSSDNDPPSKVSVPPVKSVGTPPSKVSDINIKEIKTNNIKNIGTSDEALDLEKVSCKVSKKKKPVDKQNRYGLENIVLENFFDIPIQMIWDWIANREKKRAPVTHTAWHKVNRELGKCKELGIDPVEAFETMVASGWQSLKVEYFENHNKASSSQWDVDSVMSA